MDVRQRTEEIEHLTFAPWATFSDASRGRAVPEPQDPLRPVFQRDRDRVLHCKAFRRLKQKTQVFLSPEGDLYRTRLDGQPPNENGTQYGDRGALYEWVAKQEAAGCDRYILSLDQLLSGGLVSSRAMTGENPVTLSSGETLVEAELLTAVIDLLAADENNRIWLLDTVMRLAATTGYGGFGLNEYNALRTYGMAPRPHLEGTDLTIGNIVADYPLGADGTPVPVEAEEPLPEGAVENYLASRERKLRLSDAMFQALEETADSSGY